MRIVSVKVFRWVKAQRDDAHVEIARLTLQLERTGKQMQTLRTSDRGDDAEQHSKIGEADLRDAPHNIVLFAENETDAPAPRKRDRPKGAARV